MTNFERFYITWYSRAIYFAREYVLSESDAENIVQDVFLHLYEHCDRLNAYTNLTAYLFTSIKNKCLDYFRKRVNEQETVDVLSFCCSPATRRHLILPSGTCPTGKDRY